MFSVKEKKKIEKLNEIIREEDLVYDEKYKKLLKKKRPKFLVDNMLKKLCTTMRNLGIDT